MNQKHLASVLLFAVMIAFCQGVLMLHKKHQAAEEAAEAAEARLNTATQMHSNALMVLTKTKETTAPLRTYFRMWLPEFEKIDSELKAKDAFLPTIKRIPNLVFFDQGMNPLAPNKESVFVTQRAAGRARLVGDDQKCLQMLSMVERELPTSRISSVEIRKGERANDIEVSLLVELPVIPPTAPAAGSALTAANK
jgi:hypothetical protein